MHHLWHYAKIKHHTQPWGKTDTWSIRLAKPKCFTLWLLGLGDSHHEENSFGYLASVPFQRLQQTDCFTVDYEWYKAVLHSGKSQSHLGPDHTLDSYCQIRQKKRQHCKCHYFILKLVISSVLWLSTSSSFHFKKSVSNFSVLREQHNPMVPLNPKWFKD